MSIVWVPGACRVVSALRISHRLEVGKGPKKSYTEKDDRRRKKCAMYGEIIAKSEKINALNKG